MTIDGLGPVDPIRDYKKTQKTNVENKTKKPDSVDLSAEARSKGELYNAAELVKSAPDVRAEKIAEIRRKLEDPSYINDTVVNSVADKVMEAFGL